MEAEAEECLDVSSPVSGGVGRKRWKVRTGTHMYHDMCARGFTHMDGQVVFKV